MQQVGSIVAEFQVDGKAVEEYEDPDFEDEPIEDETSVYVEAIPGAKFGVVCTVGDEYNLAPAIDYLSFDFFVDGRRIRGGIIERADRESDKRVVELRHKVDEGEHGLIWSHVKFSVSPLDISGRPLMITTSGGLTQRQRRHYRRWRPTERKPSIVSSE